MSRLAPHPRDLEMAGRPVYPPFMKNITAFSFRKRCRAKPQEHAESPLSYDFNILVDFREKLNPCEEEMCFPKINRTVKNTQRYLEFINFSLGASGVVRQNLQNSSTAESSAW